MISISELGLDKLPAAERLALAEALWDSVMAEEGAALTDTQLAELERRYADSIARPGAITPWETIKARALERIRNKQ